MEGKSKIDVKNILLFFKPDKIFDVIPYVEKLSHMGFSVFVPSELMIPDLRDRFKERGAKELDKITRYIDLVLVLGGDGAILRACHKVIDSGFDVPILGVNLGRFGFLAFGESSLEEVFDELDKGNFVFESKKVMRCEAEQGTELYAVNDFVVKAKYGLIEADIFVESEYVGYVRADGVLLSTPLGSTAYNLSIGGPIVYPGTDILLLGFISPFTMSARTVVFPSDKRIIINVKTDSVLFTDGREDADLKEESRVSFQMTAKSVKIIRKKNSQFFLSLRKKFGWLSS